MVIFLVEHFLPPALWFAPYTFTWMHFHSLQNFTPCSTSTLWYNFPMSFQISERMCEKHLPFAKQKYCTLAADSFRQVFSRHCLCAYYSSHFLPWWKDSCTLIPSKTFVWWYQCCSFSSAVSFPCAFNVCGAGNYRSSWVPSEVIEIYF